MELKHLRTFQAVVDQGSYQRAAESLGYTQSTVTTQIQQLEESLGVPLFAYGACSYRWAAEAISRVCRARRRTDTPLMPSGE